MRSRFPAYGHPTCEWQAQHLTPGLSSSGTWLFSSMRFNIQSCKQNKTKQNKTKQTFNLVTTLEQTPTAGGNLSTALGGAKSNIPRELSWNHMFLPQKLVGGQRLGAYPSQGKAWIWLQEPLGVEKEGASGSLGPEKVHLGLSSLRCGWWGRQRKRNSIILPYINQTGTFFPVYMVHGLLKQKHFLKDKATYDNINYRYSSLDSCSLFPAVWGDSWDLGI